MLLLGKGGEGPGTETDPRLELNPAGSTSSNTKEEHHGEEEEGQEEIEVNDMGVSLVLGQRRHLRISRDYLRSCKAAEPMFGRFRFGAEKIRRRVYA
jgi:hypothetical protein